MKEEPPTQSGVQELVGRIREEGVQAGKEEAERILKGARAEADRILAAARAEAEELRRTTAAQIDSRRAAAEEALKLSARDTVLKLKSQVTSQFERFVKRLVTNAPADPGLVRALVLVLAGQAREEVIRDKEIQVRISRALLTGKPDPTLKEKAKEAVIAISSDMLREGVELIPDDTIKGGARVRLVKDDLEIDLSDRAVAQMISQALLPRFRAILEGME